MKEKRKIERLKNSHSSSKMKWYYIEQSRTRIALIVTKSFVYVYIMKLPAVAHDFAMLMPTLYIIRHGGNWKILFHFWQLT